MPPAPAAGSMEMDVVAVVLESVLESVFVPVASPVAVVAWVMVSEAAVVVSEAAASVVDVSFVPIA